MSIIDEIQQRKLEIAKKENNIKKNEYDFARAHIPILADLIKSNALDMAARGIISKRGIFKKEYYVSSSIHGGMYYRIGNSNMRDLFYNKPDLDEEIKQALYERSMTNVSIQRENWYVTVKAEIIIPK